MEREREGDDRGEMPSSKNCIPHLICPFECTRSVQYRGVKHSSFMTEMIVQGHADDGTFVVQTPVARYGLQIASA